MTNPDFVMIAKGYNIDAQRVTKREELDDAVKTMIASEKPTFSKFVWRKRTMSFQ